MFFNAHHSPIGAYASFTLGFPGAGGGLDLELGQPPRNSVYIGVQVPSENRYEALPFFEQRVSERDRYTAESSSVNEKEKAISPIDCRRIQRNFELGSDSWSADDLTFTVYSPVQSVPDPKKANADELKQSLVPAVWAELTIDNSQGDTRRRAFFGYEGNDPYSAMRTIISPKLRGIGQGRITGIFTDCADVRPAQHFRMEDILFNPHEENWTFGLGRVAALMMDVPPHTKRTYRFAICFYRGCIATAGLEASYYYSRYFKAIEEVGDYALSRWNSMKRLVAQSNRLTSDTSLSSEQQFMLSHAIRSYYGCTQLLDLDDDPVWIVNEGEYRMMNTFDLTIDQMFYELRMNPWTVRNELDLFVKRYSYIDTVRKPGDAAEFPGGISFTHDMGVANTFSRPSYSSYEQYGLDECFSHMTHEQLVNWVLCACVYTAQTNDKNWVQEQDQVITQCLNSLLNRDDPSPQNRTGIMGLDSNRTLGGAEITTYDSLDTSLGQARNNLYLATKTWAAYVGLEHLLTICGHEQHALVARQQAERSARTIVSYQTPDGYIPAILGENNHSKIIPAIEGLVFPYYMDCADAVRDDGHYGFLIQALRTHLKTVLSDGVCLFPDGGWKLSSTSNNSWLSKIYLCQFVARQILQVDFDTQSADKAHVGWLTHPELSIWSWSDQILQGEIIGSKYYPRGVTGILWLEERSMSTQLGGDGNSRYHTVV